MANGRPALGAFPAPRVHMGAVESSANFPFFRFRLTPGIDEVLNEDELAAEYEAQAARAAAERQAVDAASQPSQPEP